MTPLIKTECVNVTESLLMVIDKIEKSGYTRLPVYQDRTDNIAGYISCKDLTRVSVNTTLPDIKRDCVFIPETKTADSERKLNSSEKR